MSSLLEISGVTVHFGGVTAVDDVSLEVRPNELLGFIGPNGAGKTTLMRVITGMVTPQKGTVKKSLYAVIASLVEKDPSSGHCRHNPLFCSLNFPRYNA